MMPPLRKSNLLISFSGGRTSAYMSQLLKDSEEYNPIFVFANTGKEREETLEFIHECDQRWSLGVHWIEYNPLEEWGKKNWFKVVDFKTASRQGEPFARFIDKERLPNAAYPNCSGRLKQIPIHNFVQHHIGWKDYYTAIGIRYDEKHRINWQSAKDNKYIYPLATTHRVNSQFIRQWWSEQDFDLNLKDYEGNCDFCWKKSDRKLITLIRDGLNIDWWIEQESKTDYTFFRDGKSALDLIDMSRNKKIRSVQDEFESDTQGCLFDPLDLEASCFCR